MSSYGAKGIRTPNHSLKADCKSPTTLAALDRQLPWPAGRGNCLVFKSVRFRHARAQAHTGPAVFDGRFDVRQVVGAVNCWMAGGSSCCSRSDSLPSGTRARPELRGTCSDTFALGHPRIGSVQFRLRVDLSLPCMAGLTGCRSHRVVRMRGRPFVVADIALVGGHRRVLRCLLRPVVSATRYGCRSGCTANPL